MCSLLRDKSGSGWVLRMRRDIPPVYFSERAAAIAVISDSWYMMQTHSIPITELFPCLIRPNNC